MGNVRLPLAIYNAGQNGRPASRIRPFRTQDKDLSRVPMNAGLQAEKQDLLAGYPENGGEKVSL